MRLAVALVLDHLLGPEGLRRGYMHINGAWADHVSFAALAEEAHGPDGAGFEQRLTRG